MRNSFLKRTIHPTCWILSNLEYIFGEFASILLFRKKQNFRTIVKNKISSFSLISPFDHFVGYCDERLTNLSSSAESLGIDSYKNILSEQQLRLQIYSVVRYRYFNVSQRVVQCYPKGTSGVAKKKRFYFIYFKKFYHSGTLSDHAFPLFLFYI